MSKESFSYYYLLFFLFFGVIFYDIFEERFSFTYVDEICALVLFLYFLYCWAYGKIEKRPDEFIFFLIVAIFYFIKSLIWPNNVKAAVILDFIIEIKPFIAFYSAYNIGLSLNNVDKEKMAQWVLLAFIFILPLGLMGPGGGDTMRLLTGHARYSTMAICLGTTYLYCKGFTKQSIIMATAIFSMGLLSLASKMFGFYVLFLAVFFLSKRKYYKKLLTPRNLLMLLLFCGVALFVTWEKVYFYFVEGIASGDIEHIFARPLLYMKMVEVLKDYPLFGCGFGTYATHASGVYYSPIYITYGLIYNYEIGNGEFISDTFFPVYAQFGLIGIFLFGTFWIKRIKEAQKRYSCTGDIYLLKIIILIFGFFMIESVADSTFTQNRGMYMLVMMAMFLGKGSESSITLKRKIYMLLILTLYVRKKLPNIEKKY